MSLIWSQLGCELGCNNGVFMDSYRDSNQYIRCHFRYSSHGCICMFLHDSCFSPWYFFRVVLFCWLISQPLGKGNNTYGKKQSVWYRNWKDCLGVLIQERILPRCSSERCRTTKLSMRFKAKVAGSSEWFLAVSNGSLYGALSRVLSAAIAKSPLVDRRAFDRTRAALCLLIAGHCLCRLLSRASGQLVVEAKGLLKSTLPRWFTQTLALSKSWSTFHQRC